MVAETGHDSGVTAQWLARPAPIHVDASPDGTRLAVTVTQVPVDAEDELIGIVVVDVRSGSVAPLAAAEPG